MRRISRCAGWRYVASESFNDLDEQIHFGQAVKGCSRVYLEAYTSILMVQKEKLVSTPTKPLLSELIGLC